MNIWKDTDSGKTLVDLTHEEIADFILSVRNFMQMAVFRSWIENDDAAHEGDTGAEFLEAIETMRTAFESIGLPCLTVDEMYREIEAQLKERPV